MEAGDDYLPAALRELKEELGIDAKGSDLRFAGMRYSAFEDEFYGKPFGIMSLALSISTKSK